MQIVEFLFVVSHKLLALFYANRRVGVQEKRPQIEALVLFRVLSALIRPIHEITRNRTNKTISGSCLLVDRYLKNGSLSSHDTAGHHTLSNGRATAQAFTFGLFLLTFAWC